MSDSPPSFPAESAPRVHTAGKFLRLDGRKFVLHGATYGPFGPADRNHGLPAEGTVARDLSDMVDWGANTVRLYHPPPEWFLDLCAERGLYVVVSIPWGDHVDFLRNPADGEAVIRTVREVAERLGPQPRVAALLVGNEIQSTLVRWLGPGRVQRLLETLIGTARAAAPHTLVGYANYPGTEFLQPANADFTAFNVYLEDRAAMDRYLARLQNIAGDRPLIISEFGADAKSHGVERQAEILSWEHQLCQEHGVAGNIIFSWTDEWHRGGGLVTDWSFGLTARSRAPRPAWHALHGGPLPAAQLLPMPPPRASVIVCTWNGSATLRPCLAALGRLNYPDYEVLLMDDGSTDAVPEIAREFPMVRYLRLEHAGLSAARNAGAAAATGSILAYTDDDCMPDGDWLTYLVRALQDPAMGAAGGPNIPPPAKSLAQACVTAAPGGPAHVLLSDRLAEHVPGCNLAVRRSVFDSIMGFDPKYHAAGDDVDFCWRLQEAGFGIAFHAAAMVWHDRRTTVKAFLRQQAGYGKAEALLMERHSSRFGAIGGARWRGMVYQPAMLRLMGGTGRIYSGLFGYAPFQAVYSQPLSEVSWLVTSLPWWLVILIVAACGPWVPAALIPSGLMLAATLIHTGRQAWRLRLPAPWSGWRGHWVLWGLVLAQPLVRGWSRLVWNFRFGSAPRGAWFSLRWRPWNLFRLSKPVSELCFWSEEGTGRDEWLAAMRGALEEKSIPSRTSDGWGDWDLEADANRWWRVRAATVTEYHEAPRRLTRIRFASRATGAYVLLQVLMVTVCAALAPGLKLHPLWCVGVYFLLNVVLETMHRHTVFRVAALASRTAVSAGLQPLHQKRAAAAVSMGDPAV
ncbi:MAG: glycosyl transferase family 2 [Verrucomicrobiales bacterium]|nr:glycosyl transferase family 2 [Verrucomicrobiales bacterium]